MEVMYGSPYRFFAPPPDLIITNWAYILLGNFVSNLSSSFTAAYSKLYPRFCSVPDCVSPPYFLLFIKVFTGIRSKVLETIDSFKTVVNKYVMLLVCTCLSFLIPLLRSSFHSRRVLFFVPLYPA